MLIFSKDEQIYVFIHIPKNSGRYMNRQICEKFKCYQLEGKYDIFKNPLLAPNPTLSVNYFSYKFPHFSYKQILENKDYLPDITNNTKYITFTRNPYDRMISGYFYLLNYMGKIDIIDISIERLKNLTMGEFITTIIEDFRDYIKNRFLVLFNENNYIMKQQYKYIVDENGNIPNDLIIYKLEDYETNTELQTFLQFDNFNLKRYNYADYYDNECLAIINEVYKKDFELFGYENITNIQ
jgi:hypothetical protein